MVSNIFYLRFMLKLPTSWVPCTDRRFECSGCLGRLAMVSQYWGHEGPNVDWGIAIHSKMGQRTDLVCQIACWDYISNDCLAVLFPGNKTIRISGLKDLQDGTHAITILNAVCVQEGCGLAFRADDSSVVVEHATTQVCQFSSMLELCCGAGIATFGFGKVEIKAVLAVESSRALANAYSCLHPEVDVIVGDIMDRDVKIRICQRAQGIGTLFSGFPCQPYSKGGCQEGGLDPRALPLHSVLEIALLCRIPILVLECVPDAATNRFVRKELQSFCKQCAFHMTETILRLESVWPCKRERWWVVLSASSLGPIPLKSLPQYSYPSQIKHVLPRNLDFPDNEVQQLILSAEEHARFLQFQPDIQKMLLKKCGICQTVLHSLGSQMVACRCGCRQAGFTDFTLQARGVYGFLMNATGSTQIGHEFHDALRHPHPTEVAILTATPIVQWPTDLRLMLAGLGQQATPIHALWIGSQIKAKLSELIYGSPAVSPLKMLDLYVETMLRVAKDCQPEPTMDEAEDDIPCVIPFASQGSVTLASADFWPRRHTGDADSFSIFTDDSPVPAVVRLASCQLTVGQFRVAEVGMVPTIGVVDVLDSLSEIPLPNDCPLAGKGVIVRQVMCDIYPDNPDYVDPIPVIQDDCDTREDVPISPTVPFTVDEFGPHKVGEVIPFHDAVTKTDAVMHALPQQESPPLDPLASLKPDELLRLLPPAIPNLQTLAGLSAPHMLSSVRAQILAGQGSSWADDEIRWHLLRLLGQVGSRAKVLLDPLLATHVVHSRQTALIYRWAQQLGSEVKVIITTVWIQGHWIPFAWTWSPESLVAHSWDVQGSQNNVNVLHDALAKALGARTFISHIAYRQFALTDFCGVCAVRWLDSFVSGKMLPSNQEEAEQLNWTAKAMFEDYLRTDMEVCRPWVWANGLDTHVHARLIDLLTQHGVPPDETENRAKIVTNGIGVAALQKALTGTAPWRSVKALANQAKPMVQLVLPDELAEVVKSKAEAGGIGRKNRKKTEQQKPAPSAPISLDPSKLQLASGTFVDEVGNELVQIPVSAIGPAVQGVAITTCDELEPFLKSGKQISDGAVGAFVLNASEGHLTTPLPWIQCRIAVRCKANGEPILVTGFLIQLGKNVISLAKKSHAVDAGDVNATCIKVSVYRDCFPGDWDEFVKSPVRQVLQHLLPLQVCDCDEPCDCSRWHRTSKCSIRDPVLDVWRRQWLGMNFKQVTPQQADVFVVNVRYVQEVEDLVLAMSGLNGLFLEPRSVDSRLPNQDYQVIWMPRTNLAELNHLKQMTPEIVGVARLGSRFGIRTKLEHVTSVGQQIKPEAILLSSGTRLDYEVGPIPYGMDRAAVAALFANLGWKIKPIGPLKSVEGGLGILWHIHATSEPGDVVFATKHGDVVVTKKEARPNFQRRSVVPTVASQATMQLCSLAGDGAGGEDPLFKNDPWSQAISKVKITNAVTAEPLLNMRHVEARIEKAVLAKMPKQAEPMEVDSGGSNVTEHANRLEQLEAQVTKLTQGHMTLEAKMEESQRRVDAQFSQMHHQVAVQLDSQNSHMEELFKSQLSQIESLLGKRARTE